MAAVWKAKWNNEMKQSWYVKIWLSKYFSSAWSNPVMQWNIYSINEISKLNDSDIKLYSKYSGNVALMVIPLWKY
jgi:ribonucleotide reductase beta subunit family protein with ferritin-like domain